ncbi:MAG TPA: LamG domain-containing protein, partial [Woeseiaceae bacterium]
MYYARGFAMAFVHSMNRIRSLKLTLTIALSATLTACGGGAQTTDNPVTGVTPPTTYSGPPPATADIQAFKLNVWDNIQASNRCGGCHTDGVGQTPLFARHDDINLAYQDANTVANLSQPSDSRLVTKVGGGHNCWLTDNNACADIMTTWIEGWAGASAGGGRQIVLNPPPELEPGASKSYANATVGNFANLVHTPILLEYCAGCHSSQSATSIQPYFAETDANVAFDAARSKMDLDDPSASRFVLRLRNEFHNCWVEPAEGVNTCADAADAMQAAIQAFADTVPLTQLDPMLVNSKALRLIDGTIASGGNRYENAQVALWEFKTGSGTTAFDTSGVEPAINLTMSGDVTWFGGWGITIGPGSGKAQGSTSASKKLHDLIRATGEYSIEA